MKHIPLLTLLATALAMMTACAGNPPQETMEPAAAEPTPAMQDDFATWDKDNDGWLSSTELANHPKAAHVSMVDADKDGRVSRTEYAELLKM